MECGEMLDLSLNEVEGCAMKAARGAGLSWGQAEDLGRAARWLAREGCDWAGELLLIIESPELRDPERCGPLAGQTLADRLPVLAAGDGILRTGPLSFPHWILPPVALAASASGQRMHGTLGEIAFTCGAGLPPAYSASLAGVGGAPRPVWLGVGAAQTPLTYAGAALSRSAVSAQTLALLEHYAYRTYVPNSEKSRLRGAGAPGRP
ncbi:MAG: DUF3726 domain-containing protein [Gemmobacter sp.]|jgi:hypothetical protein|nr:DUF3726 domain-containing protein [Gemmobacter sp.]